MRSTAPLFWALLIIPAAIEIAGIPSAHLFAGEIWTPLGLHHLWRYTALFAVATAPVALFGRRWLVPGSIAALVAGTVYAVGPTAAGSVAAFAFSASVLGGLIFGTAPGTRLAFMAGVAVWIVAMTLTAAFPVHYAAVYWVALALPLVIGYRETRRLALEWARLFRPRAICVHETLGFLIFAFILIAHWLIVFKPEASSDGLATHLVIPFNMARFHAFDFDFRRYIWALTPLGTDLCYSVLYILGGEYAARLINFAMLVSVALLVFRGAQRLASNAVAILMAALLVSTPLVQLVTGSLFVENFVAAMSLAGVVALWRYRESRQTRYLLLMALLLGTAVSLKLAAVAVVLAALPLLKGTRPAARAALATAAILVATACLPYAHAWWRSGNPVFPYANHFFQSPYVGTDLFDPRFLQRASWNTPVRLTLYTHDYYEGQNGTFGFQYLLLLPLMLAYLIAGRAMLGRSATAIGLGAAVMVAITQPNARYFYVALPFLSIGAAGTIAYVQSQSRTLAAACVGLLVAVALVNFYFLPASNYHHRDFYSSPLLKASGRQESLEKSAPVRAVIAWLNRTAPSEPVFFADGSQIAGLLAPAHRNSWHDYAFWKQVEASPSAGELYVLLNGLGIRHIIMDDFAKDRGQPVTDLIVACGDPEYRLGSFSALRLAPDCESRLATAPRPATNVGRTPMPPQASAPAIR